MIPHIYQDIDGWFSAQQAFVYLIEKTPEYGIFIECGVWKGKSTSFLVVEFANRKKKVELISVDHFKGSKDELTTNHKEVMSKGEFGVRSEFMDNVVHGLLRNESYGGAVRNYVSHILYPYESKKSADFLGEIEADVIHIDMGHSCEEVKEDIATWLPKVKKGGILAGDDYDANWPGVVQAVDETLGDVTIIGTTWIYHNDKPT